ncbi:hypothetical protein [Paenibacillus silvae]|uniref:hypothetical protein n=1 Tax=Paenibacillus silvae TaxID=1325358 RepID=UPI0011A46D4A|nr:MULTISPECIES: hypothetical protein [Paenibacillus]MCK6074589.1 GNAT family N-acetyltransferase [Paenibacillus silvae]MCK6147935.1 GNAT family N-acetyltransferase [Paenibacillus silvae]MCK6266233.1 GNAT family N-acetyltransferase [Paenibacillus silvae]
MITELGLSQFYQVKHLTDAYRNIEVKAVVSGMNPGRIYVDDADNIKAALIWVHGQSGYQLVGDAESKPFRSELRTYMQTHILPELMALQMTEVETVLLMIAGKMCLSIWLVQGSLTMARSMYS